MRTLIRAFFKLIRALVTPFLMLWERVSGRPAVRRDAAAQAALDAVTATMALYQFRTCPFCVKTRIRIARLALNVPFKDAQHDALARRELQEGGGKIQVPCLRIRAGADAGLGAEAGAGGDVWLYESDAIIAYLDQLAAGDRAAGG